MNSEFVHEQLTTSGEKISSSRALRMVLRPLVFYRSPLLEQQVAGIDFPSPVGLAAGFDYEAKLPDIVELLGFGFATVGTITYSSYRGNPSPRLGRLVASKSLMVNKGFKNNGIHATLRKLRGRTFTLPIGISIGQTNSENIDTVEKAIDDIIRSFTELESTGSPLSYYELNISCPNLMHDVTFYQQDQLSLLLERVTSLRLTKPLFIKMPIDRTDNDIKAMLDVIVRYPVQGVIFGNLLKDRTDASLQKHEVNKYPHGNFSGKPTEKRSNELIKLTYQYTNGTLPIIGCGGIFTAEDAYRKIRLGASLVQLITGLIFEGPHLPSRINKGLEVILLQNGFSSLQEIIGIDAKG